MNKKIVIREDLLAPMKSGLTQIAGIVKKTLGPGGLPIIIERLGQNLEGTQLGPKITKDGVSVAEECASANPEEDLIIQAVKGICKKTVNVAGDGTTTAVVLGEALVNITNEILAEDPTLNPQLVKESLESATKEVIRKLRKKAKKVQSYDIIKQVATISANGDEEIGNIIGEAFEKVGVDGVITVDEGGGTNVTLDVVEGYQFNRGAQSRNAFFNNKDQTCFEAENAHVIIYDGKLYNFTDLIPALKILADTDSQGRRTKNVPTVLIANEFSPEVLQFLMIQKTDGGMQVCCVEGPNTTHVRSSYYDDLAVYTGGTRLGNGTRALTAVEPDDIGTCRRIKIDKYKTTLYAGDGDEEAILERVNQLRAGKAQAESPYDAQLYSDRIASLTNGIAKIGVGGITEFEIKEKYDRIEDALNAARAAIEEGVVPGGGTTLLRIAYSINPNKSIGHKILRLALVTPFQQILLNIGLSNDAVEKLAIEVIKSSSTVYDARNKKIRRAMASGIIDPVKVTRTALENAVSISSLLSTAGGCIIYDKSNI